VRLWLQRQNPNPRIPKPTLSPVLVPPADVSSQNCKCGPSLSPLGTGPKTAFYAQIDRFVTRTALPPSTL